MISGAALAAYAAAGGLILSAQVVAVGGHLTPGMRLTYSSGGVETPWVIDSVRRDLKVEGHQCIRIWIRTSPTQAQADTRTHCVSRGTMNNWDEKSGVMTPARALSPHTLMSQPGRSGSVRYEVAGQAADTVSGVVLAVLPTIVSTVDSTGRITRRLRERFAPAIATATWGVFEVPDSTVSGGWRTAREFKLVAIAR